MRRWSKLDSITANVGEQPAKREDIGAYIEIHIEQGSVLEYKQKQIGVVTAIVGQIRLTVVVTGTSNHAGTTPMTMRKDALAGAAEMVALTEQMALEEGEPLVATVGRLEVKRGTSNVVPGEVEFTLDIRHTDERKMDAFRARLLAEFEEIAMRRELHIDTIEIYMPCQWLCMKGFRQKLKLPVIPMGSRVCGCRAGQGMMLSCSGRYVRRR